MPILANCLISVEKFETWLSGKGMWFEDMCKNWNRSTTYRKQVGLVIALAISVWTGFVGVIAYFKKNDNVHFGWLLVPFIVPFTVCLTGYARIEDLRRSHVVKRHSIVLDVVFFILSVAVSVSIGLTGLKGIPLMVSGWLFIIWTSIIEMVFDIATPMGLVGVAVSGSISVTLNTSESVHKALVSIPVLLGVLVIVFSWRYKKHVFTYPNESPPSSPPPPPPPEASFMLNIDMISSRNRNRSRFSTGSLVDGNFNPGAALV